MKLKEKLETVMTVLFILSAALLGRQGAVLAEGHGELTADQVMNVENELESETSVSEEKVSKGNPQVIVIDAGHGGDDPGKIGINGALEKDINLEIALKLKKALEKKDYEIVLTREDAQGLYKKTDRNKKTADMQKRCEIIAEINPVFTISIHQNSYTEEYVKGAQVFYHDQSEDGRQLAEIIQASLVENLDPENNRKAKGNTSYYLLKKTPTPTVIVECGFLSNHEEADLLITEAYQKKVVKAVVQGIEEYLRM